MARDKDINLNDVMLAHSYKRQYKLSLPDQVPSVIAAHIHNIDVD